MPACSRLSSPTGPSAIRETGSVWNLSGRAQSGSLAGAQLPLLVHGSPFWFAWAAFHPQTRLVTHPA